ncbi:uncharacterized protein LOC128748664 [Synchiropus splendidus]|uniref:uncharacterized protein LOC128748664 n=1 Tax=Synchiropus splendidus TaxID=270530 RepID=UPI00237E6269|nr:uncharacterized protein LOC128748664 [Synchiropus splendidus]
MAALMRVAVIGAGAAGLCAARHILARPKIFAPPVLFELSEDVGGTWRYDERVGCDDNGRAIHSSMYRNLRTNLPKEVMMFPDFPFEEKLSSFLPHEEVQRYLQSYCQNFGIRPHIRFNTAVERVKPVSVEDEATRWEVTSYESSGCWTTQIFDSVFVCSGHYADPHIPHIPGLDNFKGQVLHSHSYRSPEPFAGRSVVVLGAGASGMDISIELANAGASVILSHNRPLLTFPLPPGIQQAQLLLEVADDGTMTFQDRAAVSADVLLLCTGYNFNYPFLEGKELGLEIQDHLVTPLYRFLMPPAYPSLFFIGICKIICPFPNFHIQVQYALAVLDRTVTLPSRAQMEAETRQELQKKSERGVEQQHLLKLEQDQWDYCTGLAKSARFPPLPPVIRSLYEEVWRQRRVHPQNYRLLNYKLTSDIHWTEVD